MKNIALFGFGTVGGGVGDILHKHFAHSAHIAHVAVKSLSEMKESDFLSLPPSVFTEDHSHIWNDETVDIVVECVGGTGIAKTIIETALQNKKNVVTANKAVLSMYGNELLSLAEKNGTTIRYEASVAGGIPILETLNQHCHFGKIEKIEGIINGTCNYILSEMEQGREYTDVLAEAQQKGFAEADPTADVGGWDSADKIGILYGLAFQKPFLSREEISVQGIDSITQKDIQSVQKEGKTFRLVASCTAEKAEVKPEVVPKNGKLGSITGPENIVIIHHEYLGEISLTGPGAGRYPTAVSVVADIAKFLYE